MTALIIFTDLHHRISLLVVIFSGLLSRALPSLDCSCHYLFVRILLKFFFNNQVFNADTFKTKLQTSLLRKKRSYQEFRNASDKPPVSENSLLQKNLVVRKPKVSSNLNFERKGDKIPFEHCPNSAEVPKESIQNLFSFLKNHLRSSSEEFINIGEVCRKLLSKLAKFVSKSTVEE